MRLYNALFLVKKSTGEKKNTKNNMYKFITDPRFFNYVIMSLYVINASRWAIAGKWGDVSYWVSAAMITASVTWGYKH
jgi:hypothetical protein